MAKLQLALTRAADGMWTMATADSSYTSPVNVESIRLEGIAVTVSQRRVGWPGLAQTFQCSFSVTTIRGQGGLNGLLKAMIAEVGIVKPFYFEWPQELDDTGTDGGLGGTGTDGGRVAKAAVKGDNTITLNEHVPVPNIGRYVTFKPKDGKLYQVVAAPAGAQSKDYEIGLLPALVDAVPSTALMYAHKPVTKAMFVVKPQFPTVRSIVMTGTCVVGEVLP